MNDLGSSNHSTLIPNSAPAPLARLARRVRRAVAGSLALALLVGSTGCYGAFPLTRAVYKFNGECSSNKFVQTLVFWGFVWFPVYGLAGFADAIILNVIEFWSGEQVDLAAGPSRTRTLADGSILIEAPRKGGGVVSLTFTPEGPDRYAVTSPARGRVGSIERASDGELKFLSATGATLHRAPASDSLLGREVLTASVPSARSAGL